MQLETGFPSSHQLKSYVAFKSRLKLVVRAVLSADAGVLVETGFLQACCPTDSVKALKRYLHSVPEKNTHFIFWS